MSLPEILAAARPIDGGFAATIPADWMQGRTTYGGLSAALALVAAQQLADDLPPLRSATVNFVGPLAGDVEVRASCCGADATPAGSALRWSTRPESA